MPHILAALTLIFTLFLRAFAAPALQTPPPTQQELETAARAFVDQLTAGDYTAASATFDPTMAAAVPPARLQAIWEDMLQRYGPLQAVEEAQVSQVNEYTAVNLKTRFERASVNVRVVYNQSGQVSGFFQTPLELTGRPSTAVVIGLGFAAAFILLLPVALAIFTRRKWGVSWKYFFLGAGIFVLFQVFTRIPIISIIEASYGAQLRATPGALMAWLVVLSFTAGLFEEVGRYIGYRWLMPKDPKTWAVGVMYGLGHGGIEAILLAGLSVLSSLLLLLFWPQISGLLPAAQLGPVAMQIAPLLNAPAWLPLLSAWERLCAITLHVALSLLVLQVFRRGKLGWLWLSIGVHGMANLLVIGLPILLGLPTESAQWVSMGLLGLVGLGALVLIWRLRDRDEIKSGEINTENT